MNATRIRELLARGTGRGVKVAVIDTGVESTHPHLEDCIKGCYEVVPKATAGHAPAKVGFGGGRPGIAGGAVVVAGGMAAQPAGMPGYACVPCPGVDMVGHGTACAGIIHTHAPEAEIYSVRVIGANAAGTGDHFLAGLAWAIDNKMDLVNLSLGTTQKRFHGALHDLADKAYFQGTILVAAANNYQVPSYPSVFASLIAVDNQSFPQPLSFRYYLGRPIEVEAQGIYVKAPTREGKYQLWTGTSFACPHITAILARMRSVLPDLTPFQAKMLLWSLRENAA